MLFQIETVILPITLTTKATVRYLIPFHKQQLFGLYLVCKHETTG